MKNKLRIWLFFPLAAAFMLGMLTAAQALDFLPKHEFTANLVESLVVSFVATIFFVSWARRRQKRAE